MKLNKILAASLLSLSMVAGVGAGIAVNAGNFQVDEVKADDVNVSGTISINMGSYWDLDSASYKVAVYFYDDTVLPKKEAWSGLTSTLAHDASSTSVTYSLNFEPKNMIAVRLNSAADAPGWPNKWNQTSNLAFVPDGLIDITSSTNSQGGFVHPCIMSDQGTGNWANVLNLTSHKVNAQSHTEYYTDSLTLAASTKFKVRNGSSWYGNGVTSFSEYVDFEYDGDANIVAKTAGTYSVYYDIEDNSIYLNDPLYAAADEWAQSFLGISESSNTCAYSKEHWATSATSYASLSSNVKSLFANKARVEHDVETTTYFAEAVQRYDYVLELYGIGTENTTADGFVDFMGRESKLNLSPSSMVANSPISSSSNAAMIAAVAGGVMIAAIGASFLLRRKKEN